MPHIYYDLKQFFRNLPLFLKLAWGWRNWDSTHTIDVLVALIKEHAKDQLADKWHINHVKRYRKAMQMSGLLEQAYSPYRYPTLNYLRSKVKRTIEDGKLVIKCNGNEEILYKMLLTADNKTAEIIEARKAYAWEFLNKHIERMWS